LGNKGRPKIKEEIEKRKKEKEDKPKKKDFSKASKNKLMEGVQGIIRLAGADLNGTKPLYNSLLKVKGIGQTLALVVPRKANIDKNTITGKLTEEQIKKVEEVITNLSKHNIPTYFLNRRKDIETGEDKHVISSDLIFTKRLDIDRLRKFHTYRGMRHESGLPSRGQRTRGSFRKGARIGVSKKAARKGKGAQPSTRKVPKFYTPKVLPKPGEKKEKKK